MHLRTPASRPQHRPGRGRLPRARLPLPMVRPRPRLPQLRIRLRLRVRMMPTATEPTPRHARPCFLLGTHHPGWLATAAVPLFVSDRRLRAYRRLPRAAANWALDSGGFTELATHGSWEHGPTPAQYVARVRRYARDVGRMAWAAPQDWMCEPFILAKTGLSVAEHQARTIANYLRLRNLAPDLPFVPVLQGWTLADYLLRTNGGLASRETGLVLVVDPGCLPAGVRRQYDDRGHPQALPRDGYRLVWMGEAGPPGEQPGLRSRVQGDHQPAAVGGERQAEGPLRGALDAGHDHEHAGV